MDETKRSSCCATSGVLRGDDVHGAVGLDLRLERQGPGDLRGGSGPPGALVGPGLPAVKVNADIIPKGTGWELRVETGQRAVVKVLRAMGCWAWFHDSKRHTCAPPRVCRRLDR